MTKIDDAIERISQKCKDNSQERVRVFLVEQLKNGDEQLANGVLLKHKTIDTCWKHIFAWAKKKATGNSCCIEDSLVYSEAIHYFTDVDDAPKVQTAKPVAQPTEVEEITEEFVIDDNAEGNLFADFEEEEEPVKVDNSDEEVNLFAGFDYE